MQSNWQHRVHKTKRKKTKTQHKTVGHHCTQAKTNTKMYRHLLLSSVAKKFENLLLNHIYYFTDMVNIIGWWTLTWTVIKQSTDGLNLKL